MRMRGFITLVTLLLLTASRAADIATTLYFNPSLDREGNLLVLLLGGGFGTLVISTTAFWLLCVGLLIAFWRSPSLRLSRSSESFWEYLRTWLRRVIQSRQAISSSLPGGSHWNEGLQAIRLFGLALPWAIISASAAAIHAWFATTLPAKIGPYQVLYSAMHVGRANYLVWLVAPGGFLVGALIFFLSEYYSVRNRDSGRSPN
jgi:hypothetical protein